MSWPTRQIGQFTHIVTKGTTPTKKQGFTDSGVNFIKAEALNGDSDLDISGGYFISEDVHQSLKRSMLEKDDVLLTIAGANIGKCGIVEERHLPANTNQAVGIMRIDPKQVIPRFLYYWFKQPQTFRYIQGLNAQAAQPNINLSMLRNIEVPVPSMFEQEQLVDILSAYDDLIENNRRRIKLLEQAAQLLYKEWFVHLRFPGHEHTKIIDGVPEGWDRLNLEEIATISKGKNITKEVSREGDVPVVAGGLHPAYYHDEANTSGPVITISASGANAGYVALYHGDIWASDCSYLSSSDNPEIWFLYLSLRSRQAEITGMQQGAAQPHVYPRHLKRLSILIPPEKLRKVFHDIVDANFLQMANLEKQIVKLAKARDLLLPKLMNGEVAV